MLNSSLLNIIRSFDEYELKRFDDFVKSPFFNKKSNVVKLFSEIKMYAPGFTSEKLAKEEVWKKIFQGKSYNYGIMKNLIHELQKLSQNFLQILNSEKNEIIISNRLLIELMRRKLDNLFEKEVKIAKRILSNSKIDSVFYKQQHEFQSIYQSYFFNNKISIEKYSHIPEFNSSLLKSFFITFFARNASLVTDQVHLKINTDEDTLNSVRNYFLNSSVKDEDDVLIFYYYFMISVYNNQLDSYKAFRTLLEKNHLKYNKRQLYSFYTTLFEFCHKNSGNDFTGKETFEVCKSMLQKGLHNNGMNKYMNPFLFLDFVEAALRSEEYIWTKDFIDEYTCKLHPEFSESFRNKALILYLFETKKYDKALECISLSEFDSPRDKLLAKLFQFKIYYEQNDIDGLGLLIDSSRHYASIDKNISGESKKGFLKFTSIMKKLLSIKSSVNKDKDLGFKIKNLKEEILSEDLIEKKWLNLKINELS